MFPICSPAGEETKNRASVNFGNPVCDLLFYGGGTRIRTGDEGFAVLCLTAWLCRHEGEYNNQNIECQGTEKPENSTEY